MKICYIDVETTGLSHWKNGIIQLAGCIETNGKVMETFNFEMRPHDGEVIEDKALACNKLTVAQVTDINRPSSYQCYKDFTKLLSKHVSKYNKYDKLYFCGYNSQAFDMDFVRSWFKKHGDNFFGSYFWSVSLDVMIIAQYELVNDRASMNDFKLGTVAKHVGLEVDESKQHEALYDIMLTRDLLRHFTVPKISADDSEEPEIADDVPVNGRNSRSLDERY